MNCVQGYFNFSQENTLKIYPFNEAYVGLLETMNNTFEAKINSYSLLLGNPGMGKSCAVYYAFINCQFNTQMYIEKLKEEDENTPNTVGELSY